MKERVAIATAITAALVRLIPLQWLHPLNWDEIEFFRATDWIARGLVPYRDFWEHHTPLAWFLFAPVALLTKSPGVDAILAMRWAQVPVWIATFWLANLWMRGVGLERFARWSAIAFALCSSMFMIPAVEYRVDSVACLCFMAGLVLAQRDRFALAGIAFCLTGFANLRLGPLLVVTVLALWLKASLAVRRRPYAEDGQRPTANGQRQSANGLRILIGGAGALGIALLYFVATRSLVPMYQMVWVQNYLGDHYATAITGGFLHRLIVPFGVRILASDKLFELVGVDVAGIVIILAGFAGIIRALLKWRAPDDLFVLAVLQLVNIAFIAKMKFVYHYHFEIVVILMLPLVASVIAWMSASRTSIVVAVLALAWCVNGFASIFRGKELDRAYQDVIMREADAHTLRGETVWSGLPWALRRDPSYPFWFLPELARQLVVHRHAPPYSLGRVIAQPPAAVVFDRNAFVWIATVQRELAPFFVRHYLPAWRNLWIPAMNGRLAPGARGEWIVPRDGDYRLIASAPLANHTWFHDPLRAAGIDESTITLPPPAARGDLQWFIDGAPAHVNAVTRFRKGQHIGVISNATQPLGIILLSGNDRVLFRQPPRGVTLEAETPRITHIPHLGVQLPR
ncbi:MAG TPA: hypothetical protein VMU84_01590 [Thermoanaerobaculia bacterium]|nr:hypothetical protein [Thermoanaerobaculia bacterium]